MRDTKLLETFSIKKEKEEKEKNLFKNLRKEVEIGANGTQEYIMKKGINKGKISQDISNLLNKKEHNDEKGTVIKFGDTKD